MKKLDSHGVRSTFIDFMKNNGHMHINGASIIPVNDPSLLFINAGMAPMKSYFSGQATPPQSDLCNVQPCIRTIDIDDIGDRHHLTFFEMLGSWSINNYFKEHAIELASDLLMNHFEYPKEKLYVTVYGGDKDKGIPADEESAKIWQKMGFKGNQIVTLGEDNFWSGGDTGPCGPCTEIFYDTGDKHGKSYEETGFFDTKNRYIEIWNAGVFMQYNRKSDGTMEKLPFKSVDTGSGVERMVMNLNNFESVYETDVLKPYVDLVKSGFEPYTDMQMASVRLIADHMRTSTLILSENVYPGKDGRNYIPRRLIRRSASVQLSQNAKFNFNELINTITANLGNTYPKVKENANMIHTVINKEISDFQRSVKNGIKQFDKIVAKESYGLSGQQIFDLRSSYGLPLDLIAELAKTRSIILDMDGYKAAFAKHQDISRQSKEH